MLFNPLFLLCLFIGIILAFVHIKQHPRSFLGKNWQKLILGTGAVLTIASIVSIAAWNISYRRTWPDPNHQPFEPFAVLLVLFLLLSLSILLIGAVVSLLKWRRSRRKHK